MIAGKATSNCCGCCCYGEKSCSQFLLHHKNQNEIPRVQMASGASLIFLLVRYPLIAQPL